MPRPGNTPLQGGQTPQDSSLTGPNLYLSAPTYKFMMTSPILGAGFEVDSSSNLLRDEQNNSNLRLHQQKSQNVLFFRNQTR